MTAAHDFGRACEAVAARHLEDAGWTILARNFRSGRAEIDLIIGRAQLVAFVEVKGRNTDGYGHPLDAITGAKRMEIVRVARWWIARHGSPLHTYRFDAVAVTRTPGGTLRVEHFADAWRI